MLSITVIHAIATSIDGIDVTHSGLAYSQLDSSLVLAMPRQDEAL
ncbi:MAG: hypothetical protein AAFY57_17825 [Cyanobacteria bacterium J06642_2]